MSFKKELNDLHEKHKKEIQDKIAEYLTTSFKAYFEQHPKVKSVKVNAYESYNDNDYDKVVASDPENIAVNEYRQEQVEYEEEWDSDEEYIENIGMNREEYENATADASDIFANIESDIMLQVYGTYFGLRVTPKEIIIESSDIEAY